MFTFTSRHTFARLAAVNRLSEIEKFKAYRLPYTGRPQRLLGFLTVRFSQVCIRCILDIKNTSSVLEYWNWTSTVDDDVEREHKDTRSHNNAYWETALSLSQRLVSSGLVIAWCPVSLILACFSRLVHSLLALIFACILEYSFVLPYSSLFAGTDPSLSNYALIIKPTYGSTRLCHAWLHYNISAFMKKKKRN